MGLKERVEYRVGEGWRDRGRWQFSVRGGEGILGTIIDFGLGVRLESSRIGDGSSNPW